MHVDNFLLKLQGTFKSTLNISITVLFARLYYFIFGPFTIYEQEILICLLRFFGSHTCWNLKSLVLVGMFCLVTDSIFLL